MNTSPQSNSPLPLSREELRTEFFRHGIMNAFRAGRGSFFRMVIPHKPEFWEISKVFFDKGPVEYEMNDTYNVIFERLYVLGIPHAYVIAEFDGGAKELIIPPFEIPEGGKGAIPSFPEEG